MPPHRPPVHWFWYDSAPQPPSGPWWRASHLRAASTALSVAIEPPPRATRFSRPPNRPPYPPPPTPTPIVSYTPGFLPAWRPRKPPASPFTYERKSFESPFICL